MHRLDRLVATILLLQSRRIVRARDIASHFGTSIRTVYRDIQALCEAGVPIAAEPGEGYSLVEGYHLPPVMFTREEASAILLGAKFVEKHTDASLLKHTQSALLKIKSVLPETTRDYLSRLQDKTALLPPSRVASQGSSDRKLVAIQEAVVSQQVLEIDYYSAHRASRAPRLVEPLGLLHYADRWHLIAYCRLRHDFRDFRTDRIARLRVTGQTFEPRPGFSLETYLRDFGKIENPTEIQVRFHPAVADHVRDKHGYGLVSEQPCEDGVIMTFIVPNLEWTAYWLLSYGGHAHVLSPPRLQTILRDLALRVAARYEDSSDPAA